MRATLLALAVAAPASALPLQETPATFEPHEVPDTMSAEEARSALERSLGWLVGNQREDGGWASPVLENVWEAGFSVESYYAWRMASSALAVQALLVCDETPERRESLERGLEWLTTTRMPKRGSDWDVDYVWTCLYAVDALTLAAADERFAEEAWREKIDARGRAFVERLERNQSPHGGWGYYDFGVSTGRPKMHTSFSTACVLPGLQRALELGWSEDQAVLDRAAEYVRRCALPNGAYLYGWSAIPRVSGESIANVRGSLGRTQVCNWGLARTGDRRVTEERVREGLADFFEHHRFLDVARMRPIPHEAYYANAGYFYLFAHYYAAEAIELLPEGEREGWHARLRPHLVKVQYESGASTDFLATGYLVTAGTAFTAMALELGMDERAEGEAR